MTIKDEILSAYLDGELEPEEAERVRAFVARDDDLAERLERLRLAGELTREAFAPLSTAPHALRAAAGVSWRRYAAPAAAAIAACAAGVVLGVSIRGEGAGALLALDGGMIAAPTLAHGLSETVSGASSRRGGVTVSPLYSFRDGENRACRVFRSETDGASLEGAACRENRSWRIEALAQAASADGAYMQAGGDEPAAVAATVDRLWAEEIESEEEAQMIARGWR